jgi:hypothetical protein
MHDSDAPNTEGEVGAFNMPLMSGAEAEADSARWPITVDQSHEMVYTEAINKPSVGLIKAEERWPVSSTYKNMR